MKKLLLALLTVIATLTMNAEKVSKQEALLKAQQFMPGKQFGEVKAFARGEKADSPAEYKAFYIFNAGNKGGFVIVSGDDRTESILGYSDRGSLNPDSVPDNVKGLLNYYEKALTAIANDKSYIRPARTRGAEDRVKVETLMATEWGQNFPYNIKCPIVNGQRSLTGCVATALAQVLNYNRWPKEETSSVPAYTTWSKQIAMSKLEPIKFGWGTESLQFLGNLMFYCGQAVEMNYGVDESAADVSLIPDVLKTIFGYPDGVQYVIKENYTEEEWDNMMYTEMAGGRPVIYSGFGEQMTGYGGHAFVIDGYDSGRYHINWGWDGESNGMFMLTGLNVSGGSFNDYQDAVIGDGELSEREAAAVSTLGNVFRNSAITSFTELKYFTGLSSISNNAFTYCKSLESLCIPANVAGIGESVFAGCSKLTSLTVDTGNKYLCVEDGILYSADLSQLLVCLPYKTGALTIKDKVRVLADNAFYNCTGLTSIILPSQLQYISLAVFVGCSSLKTFNIPASVLSIGYGSFTGCTNLQSIMVDAGNENYTSVGGVLYNKDLTTLLAYPYKGGAVFEIPKGTTSVEAYAFCLTGIQGVDIPASVTRLGSNAMSYCDQLTKITVHAPKPFILDENAFSEDFYDAATLYVPKGKQSLYEEAAGWSAFKTIKELEYSEELGDADNNGGVDDDDVKAIARYITEGDYEGFCFDNADMNGDQKVDAVDIVLLVQTFLLSK